MDLQQARQYRAKPTTMTQKCVFFVGRCND
nr:MAG TPA: hypothetical protein [Caudoviricetes sp.]